LKSTIYQHPRKNHFFSKANAQVENPTQKLSSKSIFLRVSNFERLSLGRLGLAISLL